MALNRDRPTSLTAAAEAASPGLVVPLVGITASEALLFVGLTELALWGHFVTLLVCVVAPLRFRGETGLFRAFALVPLFRLVNLGMPVFFELTLLWFPLIYGPLIPGLYLVARRRPPVEPPGNPGLVRLRALVPVVVVLSAGLGVLEFWIIRPEALIESWTLDQLVLVGVVMIGFVGLVEELLFRGVLQRTLEAHVGYLPGLLLASGVFGLMHSGYGVGLEVVFAGVIGLVFGILYDWTDSLALVSIMHGTLNVFLFAVIPLRGSLVGI